jgi:hypothetical protein
MRITAMTAVALPHPAAPALVSAEHVHDLITERMQLQRELKAATDRAVRAERELAHERTKRDVMITGMEFALDNARVADALVVDGRLVVLYETGAVYQMQDAAVDAPGQSGYRQLWVALPSLPDSIAAVRDAQRDEPEYTGMAVVS